MTKITARRVDSMRSESVWNGAVALIFTAALLLICLLFSVVFASEVEADETVVPTKNVDVAYELT